MFSEKLLIDSIKRLYETLISLIEPKTAWNENRKFFQGGYWPSKRSVDIIRLI